MADPEIGSSENPFVVSPSSLIPLVDHLTSRLNYAGRDKMMTAPFIWGAPGIGKTEIVRTIADARKSRIVALHLPQFDPTDIKGIPVRMDDGTIRWMPSSYLPQQHTMYCDNVAGSDVGVDAAFKWEYAEDVAVYIFDRKGKEISRYNDPTLPNSGPGKFDVRNEGRSWKVSVTELPKDAYKVVVEDKAIIFLDELSSADPSTQNAALQLVLDRRVGEYDVPHCVPVIAAGNRESDGAFVQALSHPLCNRFAHITLVPNADDWIDWAVFNKLPPEIIGFIKWEPKALFDYKPDTLADGQYGFPTPRSNTFLAEQYAPIEHFMTMVPRAKDEEDRRRRAEHLRMVLFAGIIGKAYASKFIGFLQVMHDLPSPHDVMAGIATDLGDVERSKAFGLLYGLVYNLENVFINHYDRNRPVNDQPEEWTTPRDNIIKFISDNFDSESASWAMAVLFQQTDINPPSLRCDEFLSLSRKYVHVMERIMNTPRS